MELPDTINAKNDIDQNGRALFLPFFDARTEVPDTMNNQFMVSGTLLQAKKRSASRIMPAFLAMVFLFNRSTELQYSCLRSLPRRQGGLHL